MNIYFISNKIQNLFHSADGKSHIKKLQSLLKDNYLVDCMLERIIELVQAESLLDIKKIQNANLHTLWWTRRYELAIDVDTSGKRGRRRIIFEQINWENVSDDFYNESKHKTVTDIKIVEVSDHYK